MKMTSIILTLIFLAHFNLQADSLSEARKADLKADPETYALYLKAAQDETLSPATRTQAGKRVCELLLKGQVKLSESHSSPNQIVTELEKIFSSPQLTQPENLKTLREVYKNKFLYIFPKLQPTQNEFEIQEITPEERSLFTLEKRIVQSAAKNKDFKDYLNDLKSIELELLGNPEQIKQLAQKIYKKTATQGLRIRCRMLFGALYFGGSEFIENIVEDPKMIHAIGQFTFDPKDWFRAISFKTRVELSLALMKRQDQLTQTTASRFINSAFNEENIYQSLSIIYNKDPQTVTSWVNDHWQSIATQVSKIIKASEQKEISKWPEPINRQREFPILHFLVRNKSQNSIWEEKLENILIEKIFNPLATSSFDSYEDIEDLVLDNGVSIYSIHSFFWNRLFPTELQSDWDQLTKYIKNFNPHFQFFLIKPTSYHAHYPIQPDAATGHPIFYKEYGKNQGFRNNLDQFVKTLTQEELGKKIQGSEVTNFIYYSNTLELYLEKTDPIYLNFILRGNDLIHVDSQEMYDKLKVLPNFKAKNCLYKILLSNQKAQLDWIKTVDQLFQKGLISQKNIYLRLFDSARRKKPTKKIPIDFQIDILLDTEFFTLSLNDETNFRNLFTYIEKESSDPNNSVQFVPNFISRLIDILLDEQFSFIPSLKESYFVELIQNGYADELSEEQFFKLYRKLNLSKKPYALSNIYLSSHTPFKHYRFILGNPEFPLAFQFMTTRILNNQSDPETINKFHNYLLNQVDYSKEDNKYVSRLAHATYFSQDQIVDFICNDSLPYQFRIKPVELLSREISPQNRIRLTETIKKRADDKKFIGVFLTWAKKATPFELTPVIIDFLDDRNDKIRQAALEALQEIKRVKQGKNDWMKWYKEAQQAK